MKNLLTNKIASIILYATLGVLSILTFASIVEFAVKAGSGVPMLDFGFLGMTSFLCLIASLIFTLLMFKKSSFIKLSIIFLAISQFLFSCIGLLSIAMEGDSNNAIRPFLLLITGSLPQILGLVFSILFAIFYDNYAKNKNYNKVLIYVFGSLAAFAFLVGGPMNFFLIKHEFTYGFFHGPLGRPAIQAFQIVISVLQIPFFITFMLHKFDPAEVVVKKEEKVEEFTAEQLPGDVQVAYVVRPNTSPKRRTTAIMLCFFLGAFGAHRFYTGKIGTAILYIFTFGGFTFGVMCDMMMLLFEAFRDKQGRIVRDDN